MKRWTLIGGAVIVVAALGAGWTAVQQVRARPADGVLQASGRIEGEEIVVNSRIGGRLQQLLVREGDAVRRGQLVAVLGADELDARVRQADAQVQTARAQVLRAEGEAAVLAAEVAQVQTAIALAGAQVDAQQQQARAAVAAAEARLSQARRALAIGREQAPRAVDEARAALRVAEAQLAQARAAQAQARRDGERLEGLLVAGAVPVAQVDAARSNLEALTAQVEAAGEQVARARAALQQVQSGTAEVDVRAEDVRAGIAQVEGARGQVALAAAGRLEVARQRQQLRAVIRQSEITRAGLAAAQAQLLAAVAARDELAIARGETRVYAPSAGVVVHKVANAGEVVPAGAPLVMVVDLRSVWLKVFIPEPQIGRLRLGIPARVSVDAYPGRTFEARVTEISERAEFTPKDIQTREERVKQVFAVKLAVPNADGILKPGMPADAVILWNREEVR